MADIVELARTFAIAAHEAVGQKRKYTGEPYWHHPANVALTVTTVTSNPLVVSAAWLHDTLEDTKVTEATIRGIFGNRVAELVLWLTDVSRPEDGNREARKERDRQHIAKAPADAKTIKLADLIDNSRSILDRDPGFAKVYLREKALLLDVLRDGDPMLWNIANKFVQEGLR